MNSCGHASVLCMLYITVDVPFGRSNRMDQNTTFIARK
jgi:hypothetical protein